MAMVNAGYNDDYGNPVMVDDESGNFNNFPGNSENTIGNTRSIGGNTSSSDNSGSFHDFPGGFGVAPANGRSDLTNTINSILGSNLSGADLAARAAVLGGGLAGGLGFLSPKTQKVGYQGGIPKYTATRNMVTAPPTREQGYRPGQGGINYGGDVTYTPTGGLSSAVSGGSSGGGGSSTLGDIAKMAGGAGLAALLGNYLSKSGGSGDLASIIKRLGSGSAGGLEKMPKITDFVSKRIGDAGGSGELTTPGGEYAGADEFTGIDEQIRANENALQEPPMLNDDEVQAEFDRLRSEYPDYEMPTFDLPTFNWEDASLESYFGYAKGGNVGGPRYLQGRTDGMADKIPARIGKDQPAALSHGEFVVPADVVSHLGNGNSDAGASKLYQMMDKIRQARTGTKKQGKKINPDKFMPGGLAQAYASGGSVKRLAVGGTTLPSGTTGQEQAPASWAGEYVTNMLGQGQALANAPYQQYMGPLTAGESNLQSKVFGGLQGMNFPGNLGASFSSMGAYQAPNLNMGAYQQTPIGTGNYTRPTFEQYTSTLGAGQEPAVNKNVYDAGLAGNQIYNAAQPPMMLNQGSNGFGDFGSLGTADYIDRKNLQPPSPQTLEQEQRIQDMRNQNLSLSDRMKMQGAPGFGDGPPKQIPNTPDNLPGLNNLFNQNMQAMTGLPNQGPAQRQTYEDYISSPTQELKMPREQFEAQQDQIQKMRDQGMDMLGRGDMREIMAGLGGKPGQMPQGGLAGLAGRMQQPQPAQPQQEAQQQAQQPQNIAQQYMNPYLQSVLQPQMEELRRQAQINAQSGLGALTKSGAFGGGRQAIMESEAGRNLLAEQNKAVGQGYASAFDRAQSQFNTEQNQGMGLARLMSEQGAQQRGIEAEGIAADKAEFEKARKNPYEMIQFQQSLLSGMPINATNYTMPEQDWLTKTAGGATTVNKLLETLGLVTPTATPPAAPKK